MSDGKQTLLDFRSDEIPRAMTDKQNPQHKIYVEYEGFHHVVHNDFNIYLLRRKSVPIEIIYYETHIERYQYFESLGYLI